MTYRDESQSSLDPVNQLPSGVIHLKYGGTNPDELGEYYKKQRVNIASRMSGAKRIYLDTKYWLYMRDAHDGRPRSEEHALLYDALCSLVREHKAICPISDAAVYELLHQNDPHTRRATAEVMDCLSEQLALEETLGRVRIEILHFLRSRTHNADELHSLSDWVWTNAGHVLGTLLPDSRSLPSEINTLIQVGYYREVSKLHLVELLDMIGNTEGPLPRAFTNQQAFRLTQEKIDHQDQPRSFKHVFMIEVEGLLDANYDEIASALAYLAGTTFIDQTEVDAEIANIIEMFRTAQIGTHLPFINTQAGLHALFRWNRGQRFKSNDWLDYMHAASALPYFDFFLTERILGRIVCSPPLSYDSLYGTVVHSDPLAALALLKSI